VEHIKACGHPTAPGQILFKISYSKLYRWCNNPFEHTEVFVISRQQVAFLSRFMGGMCSPSPAEAMTDLLGIRPDPEQSQQHHQNREAWITCGYAVSFGDPVMHDGRVTGQPWWG
jgi:hypothetical protein